MKKKMITLVAIWSLLAMFLHSDVNAQEVELNYAYGAVVSTNGNALKITEYTEDGQERLLELTVTEDTGYGNVEALSDLQVGDEVEIDYVKEGSGLVVTFLSKDMPEDYELNEAYLYESDYEAGYDENYYDEEYEEEPTETQEQ